jgi:phosphohistidine phosphatase
MPERTLVLMRHAKSDWSVAASDRDRPLKARGRRQAAEAGRWLGEHVPGIELVVTSPATRARTTWDIAGASYGGRPRVATDERAYSFDDTALLEVLHELGDDVTSVLLVGHNPALDDLVARLTGEYVDMVTSALAVLRFDDAWSRLAAGTCRLVATGRPPVAQSRLQ